MSVWINLVSIVVALVLAAVILGLQAQKRIRVRRIADEKAENDHRLSQKRDHQLSVGRQIFNLLYGIVGVMSRRIDGLRIDRFESNGGRYTIYIGIEDHHMFGTFFNYRGSPVATITVDALAKDPCISVLHGPYGTPERYPLKDGSISEVVKAMNDRLEQMAKRSLKSA